MLRNLAFSIFFLLILSSFAWANKSKLFQRGLELCHDVGKACATLACTATPEAALTVATYDSALQEAVLLMKNDLNTFVEAQKSAIQRAPDKSQQARDEHLDAGKNKLRTADDLKAKQNQADQQNNNLTNKLAKVRDLEQNLSTLKEHLAALEKIKNQNFETIVSKAGLASPHDEATQTLQRKIESLQGDIEVLQNEMLNIADTIRSLGLEIQSLDTKKQGFDQRMAELKQTIEVLRANIAKEQTGRKAAVEEAQALLKKLEDALNQWQTEANLLRFIAGHYEFTPEFVRPLFTAGHGPEVLDLLQMVADNERNALINFLEGKSDVFNFRTSKGSRINASREFTGIWYQFSFKSNINRDATFVSETNQEFPGANLSVIDRDSFFVGTEKIPLELRARYMLKILTYLGVKKISS